MERPPLYFKAADAGLILYYTQQKRNDPTVYFWKQNIPVSVADIQTERDLEIIEFVYSSTKKNLKLLGSKPLTDKNVILFI